MLGKNEGQRSRGQQRMRWLDSNTNSMDMNFSKLWDIGKDREVWHAAVHRVAKSQTRLATEQHGYFMLKRISISIFEDVNIRI